MWTLMDTMQIKWDYVVICNYKGEILFHFCLLAKLSDECKKKKENKNLTENKFLPLYTQKLLIE